MDKNQTAVLLMHCEDQRGILAEVTDFIMGNQGNIINLDQHVDSDDNRFYMRIEWELEHFIIPQNKIAEYFETMIVSKFNAIHELHFLPKKINIALFVSQYSHCLLDILSRHESKEWKVNIKCIISNHEKFRGISEKFGIPFHYFPVKKANKTELEAKELALLKEHKVELIILARYMQILSDDFCSNYPNQIINIHHSSLPAFPGARPYESAHRRGVKFMGATAHYVTTDLDEGPIIAQDVIHISHRDSIYDMKRKGRNIEKIVLANACWAHLNHQVLSYNNKTVVFD
ncbi:formyltetrahydrofolate deformylase [Portibacter lacus]|uniref:Formyltetrahydrofolate deformylase n=1 Tax=Portibacter lacus TaxID=1099794 RepID=A0AA37WDP0_9BACT|nr:formyltetrahydrofolate deformylase [Portibacter lacus]GLR18131.1 formyltetrahydrofolate deformylase [Portibacter lacus]